MVTRLSEESNELASEVASQCIGVRARRLNRAITRMFDGALRPHGLTSMQFTLLTSIQRLGPVAPVRLAEALDLEKSTLSRNLKVMERNGWTRARATEDARSHEIELSASGRKVYLSAAPSWRDVQREAKRLMGRNTPQVLQGLWEGVRE
jgi:DNA-binding MarR family transcriptional regulator